MSDIPRRQSAVEDYPAAHSPDTTWAVSFYDQGSPDQTGS
jgi:hypothetical protein